MAAELGDEMRLDVLAAKTATKVNSTSLRPSARSLPTNGGEKSRDRSRSRNPSSSRDPPIASRSRSETRYDGSRDHAPLWDGDAKSSSEKRPSITETFRGKIAEVANKISNEAEAQLPQLQHRLNNLSIHIEGAKDSKRKAAAIQSDELSDDDSPPKKILTPEPPEPRRSVGVSNSVSLHQSMPPTYPLP